MRTILALSLAAFALAIPVAQPLPESADGPTGVGAFCLRQYALYI